MLLTQHDCEMFMQDLALYSRADKHTHIRGHVKVMAQTWHAGLDCLLCVQDGHVLVLTGAELDEHALYVPRRYANVHVVTSHENMLQLTVLTQARDGPGHGIFVAVKDSRVRDEWLGWLRALLGAEAGRGKMPAVVQRGRAFSRSLPLVTWIF